MRPGSASGLVRSMTLRRETAELLLFGVACATVGLLLTLFVYFSAGMV
jgi:hypothetical protein